VLSVAVIANDGMSGDALDNVFYVLGVEQSQQRVRNWPGATVFFFLPDAGKHWRLVQLSASRAAGHATRGFSSPSLGSLTGD
jgi:thiamine biosynthesis lipoprotein ApbE